MHRVVNCCVFFRCVCSVSNEFRALFKKMNFAQERKRCESLHALCALNGIE